jgi:hypothetical protein
MAIGRLELGVGVSSEDGRKPVRYGAMRDSVALFALLLVASPVVAQTSPIDSPVFSPGARVRVMATWSKQKIEGTVTSATRDSVVVDTVDYHAQTRMFMPSPVLVEEYRKLTLPISDVDSLEVSMGRSRALGVMRTGLKAALIGGAIIGVQAISGRVNPSFKQFGRGFASGMVVGASIGIPFGYSRGVERWRRVQMPRIRAPQKGRIIAAEALQQ